MTNPQRILIIKPSSLGDVATALPMLCDLRRAYPQAQVDWLIHPSLADLVRGHDAIHALIPFDRKRLASWWYRPSAAKLFFKLLRTLRGNRYDLVIDAQGLFRSGFLARYTGAPVRVGFANARELAPLAYTHKVSLRDAGKHMLAVDRMRALLGPLNVDTSAPAEARLPIAAEAAAAVAGLLGSPENFAVVIPGARWDTKRWSAEGFAQIAMRLRSAGVPVVLAGSPDERALCETIAGQVTPAPLNLAGRTSLTQMVALLARAALVVGNDSGPLHVAAALKRPIVAIYGPTDPSFVGPHGQLDHVVRFAVDCHPCRRKTCDHHSCMAGVTVEVVWEKTRAVAHIS